MMSQINSNSKKKNSVIIIISIAILLVIFSVFTRKLFIENTSKKNNLLEVPRITISIKSNENDNKHILSADFYVEAEQNEQLPSNNLEKTITSVLQNINYSLLTEQDSLKKINKLVKDKLIELYPDANIKNVYVKNFTTDYPISEPSTGNSVNDNLKKFQINN